MTIKKCSRGEYKQMLAMLNEAFEMGEHEFEDVFPQFTPYEEFASDAQIACHTIAVKDGEVVGCVGAYPRDVKILNGKIVRAFGVGQVCCKKEERGRGVMTACMNAATEHEIKNGAAFAYLWGNIPRYVHFGFKPAGGRVVFTNLKTRYFSNVCDKNALIRRAESKDINIIAGLHSRFESYAVRDESHWLEMIGRKNHDFYFLPGENRLVSELNAEKEKQCFNLDGVKDESRLNSNGGAYLFAKSGDKEILELQGEASAAKNILAAYARINDLKRLDVQYPFVRHKSDELYNFLTETSGWFSIEPSALAAVYKTDEAAEIENILMDPGPGAPFWIPQADSV